MLNCTIECSKTSPFQNSPNCINSIYLAVRTIMLEFIYTSAQQTLDGAGYGVVGKSDHFPGELEKFVRKLSRYDFLSTSYDSAKLGYPEVFSHSILRLPAGHWHVFSRIGYADQDYTQRSIFLAHHVVFTAEELKSTTVQEILRQPGLFRSKWNESPKILPPRSLPNRNTNPSTPESWFQETGDEGWAQVWAQKWQESRGHPQFLVVPHQLNPLPLYLESLETLAPEEAIQTTFITHLVADPGGSNYQWIGLIAGTALASSIERSSKDRMLDISHPLGSPAALVANINRITTARREQAAREQLAREQAKEARAIRSPAIATFTEAEQDPESEEYVPDEYRLQTSAEDAPRKLSQKMRQAAEKRVELITPDIPRPRRLSESKPNMLMTYGTVVAVLVAICIAIVAWPSKKKPEVAANQNQGTTDNSGAAAEPDPSKPAGDKKSQELSQGADPVSEPPPNKAKKHGITEVRAPREVIVTSVTSGLREALGNPKVGRGKLFEDVERLSRRDLKLNLICGSPLKLTTEPAHEIPGSQPGLKGLELKMKCEGQFLENELSLQVVDGAVWISSPTNTVESDNITFERLRFSMLEIESSKTDSKPFLLRLSFTPQAPAIPLSGLSPAEGSQFKASDKSKDEDLVGLFKAVHQWSKSPINCSLEVEGISLSILPNQGIGWPQAIPGMVNFSKRFEAPVPIEKPISPTPAQPAATVAATGAVVMKGKLKIDTRFDFDDLAKPALAAELSFTEPASVTKTADPPPMKPEESTAELNSEDETTQPASKEKGAGTKVKGSPTKGSSKGTTKSSGKGSTSTDSRLDSPPSQKTNKEETPKPASEEEPAKSLADLLRTSSDEVLLTELFHRYGRLSGKLVVRIPQTASDSEADDATEAVRRKLQGTSKESQAPEEPIEIVILRFGGP
jgi:hypothetical protein